MRRYARNQSNRISARRQRPTTASRFSFGQFATILGMGMALLLVGVTFLGDYFRVPKLTLSVSPEIISPNYDRAQDTANISYSLSEDAEIAITVFNQNDVPVRQLRPNGMQPSGQYVAVWDGLDDTGAVVADGKYTIEVSGKGVARTAIARRDITVDTQPPPLQLTNLDDITRVASPGITLEGVTEPGAIVYQAGNAQTIPVDAQGYFKIERQLTEGTNILEIFASDSAGNTAHLSHNVTLVTRPPELTILSPVNDQWLNEKVLEVTGVAPNATEVLVNKQPTAVQDDGTFTREIILREGDNTVRVEATDDVGNATQVEQVVHLKTAPPQLDLNIADGATFQQAQLQLSGRTDPGSIVRVNNQLVSVSPLGEFQTKLNLANGRNVINVETRDVAGNINKVTRRVTFESPVAQNEMTRFFDRLPTLPSLAVPILVLTPLLLLLGYAFTRPVSLLLTTDTDTFTPGMPEEEQIVTLHLNLSRGARASVRVLNKFGQPVATISSRRQRTAGIHTFRWDGYDDWGRALSPGEYTLVAEASTPSGTVQSAVTLTLRQDPLVAAKYGQQRRRGVVAETISARR